MAAGANSLKSILYALAANLSIALAKLAAALVTHSGAMMAEAIHSFADAGNQLLLLLGLKTAKRPPSPQHPLGYGKTIYFWSFIVAIMLFSMGGLYSLYEGWHKLHDPQPLNSPWIAVAVLLFAIVAEGLSFRACLVEVNKERAGRSYWRWFRETRSSALLVIFGEDLAALLGLVLALVFVLLTMITGDPTFDAYGSLAIGGLLVLIAVFIGIEVKSLIIGQGVEPRIRSQMTEFIAEQEGVVEVFNLLSLQLGEDVMVAVKVRMAPHPDADAMVARINAIEAAFKGAFPQVVWLFFEPDLAD
ncbi:cation diffusion facilitator family transporter [Ferrimonas balearica]|uniref:cation diffusion facilitator family transporter n=1 Tax=Ferrimonas balearica TaxID=44012 RepID=UPI001C98F6FC|nr:cation diffusion facilitator family transporter [Ferrimonas balearica]MBY5992482.1 cation diffusion facilitator family transporter [Ferrimonas balearica]